MRINYQDLLDSEKKALEPSVSEKLHTDVGIEKDKTVVLYCQTATRVSLPALELLDLGYKNIAIYDASWHEYGNRSDTDIVVPEKSIAAGGEKTKSTTSNAASTPAKGQTTFLVPQTSEEARTVVAAQ